MPRLLTPSTLIKGLVQRLRTQIVREHLALLEARIHWQRLSTGGATNGAPGGLMSPWRACTRRDDPLERLWALPARVPRSRRA